MREAKPWLLTGLLVLVALLAAACNGSASAPTSIAKLAKNIEPVVVRLDVSGPGFSQGGSGFFVDPRGYVLTNHHVVDNAARIDATIMSGELFSATVVADDPARDLALLKLSVNRSDFPVASLGSSGAAVLGEEVVAVGFPLGAQLPGPASFTEGIVSAFRTLQRLNYIQTDVTINPGSSGGALLDMKGSVIGITTSGIVPPSMDAEGIGLAIPIDEAKTFIQSNVGK